MEYCKKCGARIDDGSGVCPVCGHENSKDENGGNGEKKPGSTKNIVLATIAVCLIVFALVLVALVATGVIKGDKGEEEQTEEELIEATEAPDETEEPATPTPEPTPDPKEKDYEKAMQFLDNKKYEDAVDAFKKLGDYEDSKDMYKKASYFLAKKYYDAYSYKKAIKLFDGLGDYKDSKEYSDRCTVQLFIGQQPVIRIKMAKGDKKGKKPMNVTWTPIEGADGYELKWQKKSTKNGDEDEESEEASTSHTIRFSGSFKWIRARVRAYKTVSGKKYYTAWSEPSQIRRVTKIVE